MKTRKLASFIGAWLFFASTPVFAQESVVGAFDLDWWALDQGTDISDVEIESSDLSARSDLWFNQKWGVSSKLYRSNLENVNLDDTEYLNLDFKRRIFSVTDNTYLALGLGVQEVDYGNDSTSGARVLLEGRVGLGGVVYLYGQTAWIPEMDDFDGHSNVDGAEFEAGLSFDPIPNFSLKAGYRRFKIDYTNDRTNNDDSTDSTGFVIGAGFNW